MEGLDAPASTEPMVVALPGQDEEDIPPVPERTTVELEERTEPRTSSLVVHAIWQDTGEPAANVGIRLQEGWGSLGHYASTDQGGTARFEGLEPGSFDLTMDRLIPDGRSWDLELEAGETEVFELELGDGVDVRGTVVDEYGVPVADAQIVVAWGATSLRPGFHVARQPRRVGDHQFLHGAR